MRRGGFSLNPDSSTHRKTFPVTDAVGAGPSYSLHLSYQKSHFFRWHLVSKSLCVCVCGGLFCTPSVPTCRGAALPALQLPGVQRFCRWGQQRARDIHCSSSSTAQSSTRHIFPPSLGGSHLQPITHSSIYTIRSSDCWGHIWAFKWVLGRSLKQKCFETF